MATGQWLRALTTYTRMKLELQSQKEETLLFSLQLLESILIVKELVKIMKAEDLAKRNKYGGTALFFAATSGRVGLC